jgi:hypothetical protein
MPKTTMEFLCDFLTRCCLPVTIYLKRSYLFFSSIKSVLNVDVITFGNILKPMQCFYRLCFMENTTRDEIKGIDPFEKCITIASVCNLVYMTLYLESERIGIIPPHGYRPEQKQSIKAMHWLKYLSKVFIM